MQPITICESGELNLVIYYSSSRISLGYHREDSTEFTNLLENTNNVLTPYLYFRPCGTGIIYGDDATQYLNSDGFLNLNKLLEIHRNDSKSTSGEFTKSITMNNDKCILKIVHLFAIYFNHLKVLIETELGFSMQNLSFSTTLVVNPFLGVRERCLLKNALQIAQFPQPKILNSTTAMAQLIHREFMNSICYPKKYLQVLLIHETSDYVTIASSQICQKSIKIKRLSGYRIENCDENVVENCISKVIESETVHSVFIVCDRNVAIFSKEIQAVLDGKKLGDFGGVTKILDEFQGLLTGAVTNSCDVISKEILPFEIRAQISSQTFLSKVLLNEYSMLTGLMDKNSPLTSRKTFSTSHPNYEMQVFQIDDNGPQLIETYRILCEFTFMKYLTAPEREKRLAATSFSIEVSEELILNVTARFTHGSYLGVKSIGNYHPMDDDEIRREIKFLESIYQFQKIFFQPALLYLDSDPWSYD